MSRLAFSYKRFSTPEQSLGHSKIRQETRFNEIVKKYELTKAESYFDEGKSAWKGDDQQALQHFLSLIKQGQIPRNSVLVIESLDRISRKGERKTRRILEDIIGGGVSVITTNPERIYDDDSLDDPLTSIEIIFITTRSKEESDRKSERVSEAWNAKLLRAKNNGEIATARGPYWLKLIDGKWEQIEERVSVIKDIFTWATKEGLGQRAIAKRLNANKVPAFRKLRWGWAYCRLILGDKRVIGTFTSKVGEIPNYYPQIISTKQYLKAQANTAKRRRFRGNTSAKAANLFSGLAYDSDTLSTMVYVKKGATIPARWTPSKFETGGKAEGKCVTFNYDIFEEQFLRLTSDLTIHDIGERTEPPDEELDNVDTEIDKIDIQLEEMKRALIDISQPPAEVVEAINALSRRKRLLSEKRDTLKVEPNLSHKEALRASHTILERLKAAKGIELLSLRLRLRESIRSLVSRIDCTLGRTGWQSYIGATITFHSGQVRTLIIVTFRGRVMMVVADAHKWKGKGNHPGLVARVNADVVTNPDDVVEMLKTFKLTNVQIVN